MQWENKAHFEAWIAEADYDQLLAAWRELQHDMDGIKSKLQTLSTSKPHLGTEDWKQIQHFDGIKRLKGRQCQAIQGQLSVLKRARHQATMEADAAIGSPRVAAAQVLITYWLDDRYVTRYRSTMEDGVPAYLAALEDVPAGAAVIGIFPVNADEVWSQKFGQLQPAEDDDMTRKRNNPNAKEHVKRVPVTYVKRVPVTEDWYPCFSDGTVEVRLRRRGPAQWRISIWGADDFGMEKNDCGDITEALSLYSDINAGITQAKLKELGFSSI